MMSPVAAGLQLGGDDIETLVVPVFKTRASQDKENS